MRMASRICQSLGTVWGNDARHDKHHGRKQPEQDVHGVVLRPGGAQLHSAVSCTHQRLTFAGPIP